ncbi:G-protein coupled receptor Mth-like isoform X2 [Anticarsia gemmatalis]|uniref:G-protein coupled receptor Mth-like isoform X2 n=1 Tax=Anticarsia gemmatalis TaxID=129554 RepID=UPI003F7590D3
MFLYIALSLLLFNGIKTVKSESDWTDMNNARVQVDKYCVDKNCLAKCCPLNQVMILNTTVQCYTPVGNDSKIDISFSVIDVFNWNHKLQIPGNKTDNVISHFNLVQNHRKFSNPDITYLYPECGFKILEDGSLYAEPENDTTLCTHRINQLGYCIDFLLYESHLLLYYRYTSDNSEADKKTVFSSAGMLISAVFIFLVLIVYSVLPNLRNLAGKIFMAYLANLFCFYVLQSARLLSVSYLNEEACRNLSPAVYYFTLSSFFWLNVMSYDLWSTTRGMRKMKDIDRRGEVMKFLMYCVYGSAVPVLFTVMLVLIDRLELDAGSDIKVPFKTCASDVKSMQIYTHIPMGILTLLNCLFFILIAYNIWAIKKAIKGTMDSKRTKSSGDRFAIFIKIFVLTGVGWCLELITNQNFVNLVITSSYNLFIGVAIFIIFVCKKSIIRMLCKRFNVRSEYADRFNSSGHNNTKSSSLSAVYSKNLKKNEEPSEGPVSAA